MQRARDVKTAPLVDPLDESDLFLVWGVGEKLERRRKLQELQATACNHGRVELQVDHAQNHPRGHEHRRHVNGDDGGRDALLRVIQVLGDVHVEGKQRADEKQGNVHVEVQSVCQSVAPREEVHHNTCIGGQDEHHPVKLCNAHLHEGESDVHQNTFGADGQGEPPDVGPHLDEQELPAAPENEVVKSLGSGPDSPTENASEAENVQNHRDDGNGDHTPPVVLVADDALVLRQRVQTVGVRAAFEHGQGHGADAREEREHQGEVDVYGAVGVKGNLHLKGPGKDVRT
mmetsp:Transcript_107842/g.344264  ORF Transcript_107842/g.344264 Transcript_107842/m.344264 type:complete len:287 (-) Transcript_107842:204-1064(-)